MCIVTLWIVETGLSMLILTKPSLIAYMGTILVNVRVSCQMYVILNLYI